MNDTEYLLSSEVNAKRLQESIKQMKPMELKSVIVIGDIEIFADEGWVKMMVDGELALFMSRDGQYGLKELVDTLNDLVV